MTTTRRAAAPEAFRAVLSRVRSVPPVPPYVVPEPDVRTGWLRQLDGVRAALEQAKVDLVTQGWTSGAWFTVATGAGPRLVGTTEARSLTEPGSAVAGACLVGALLRRMDDPDPDRATTLRDGWGSVDQLLEAVHEQDGRTSYPAGWRHAPEGRHARLRVLTAWNDAPGRTRTEVLDLLDRAIARTVLGACA